MQRQNKLSQLVMQLQIIIRFFSVLDNVRHNPWKTPWDELTNSIGQLDQGVLLSGVSLTLQIATPPRGGGEISTELFKCLPWGKPLTIVRPWGGGVSLFNKRPMEVWPDLIHFAYHPP